VVVGAIERIEPTGKLHVHSKEGRAIIRFSADATFIRGHQLVAGLDAFMPGDEVVAEGQWTADVFVATVLETLRRVTEGRIVHRQGEQIETTGGSIRLRGHLTIRIRINLACSLG
jgi:hypothetical protein